jgi:hypothetical protein
MNLSNPQDDLSEPKVGHTSSVSLEELQYHFEGLRSLFIYVLVGLIAMTLTVDLCFIRKQMIVARAQLDDQRPKVSDKVASYKKQIEPRVRDFVSSVQTFAATNRDFQPVLDRYRPYLMPYLTPSPSGGSQAAPPKPPVK